MNPIQSTSFPAWEPHYRVEEKFYGSDKKNYKALRYSSSSFIKKPKVREFIFNKNKHRCVECGSTDNLQVDHIISVYQAFREKSLIPKLNCFENLQVLCKRCNSSKPNWVYL